MGRFFEGRNQKWILEDGWHDHGWWIIWVWGKTRFLVELKCWIKGVRKSEEICVGFRFVQAQKRNRGRNKSRRVDLQAFYGSVWPFGLLPIWLWKGRIKWIFKLKIISPLLTPALARLSFPDWEHLIIQVHHGVVLPGFFSLQHQKKDAKNIGIWKAGDSKKHQISVAIHVPKQQKNAYCIWCMVTPLKNDGKNVKLQIPRVSSLQQPAIRLFGLHGRCRMTSYRIAARPFKLESCRCFFGTPKKKPETHSFQCLPPPQQLGFSLLCRCFVFGPAQTVGVLFCWRKKRPKPIQNDSLGEALDRFFCISSWTVQWRFQASHSEGKACGVFQVNSLLEKTHTHTHTSCLGVGVRLFFGKTGGFCGSFVLRCLCLVGLPND